MYQLYLLLDATELEFPVLPEKLEVSAGGHNETKSVLQLGEINVLNKKGLKDISFESFFPVMNHPYVTGAKVLKPKEYVNAIQNYRDTLKPARLLLVGAHLSFNMAVSIEAFDYEERAGEVGDIYYTISFKEYKDYSARRLKLKGDNKAFKDSAERPGKPTVPKSHTVVRGDCLWAISKKYYGAGNRYPELYAKNKKTIDDRNKGKNVPKYTIYPSQVLTL
ncbi:LysM peptidoglycan-binding domain-containing protein [Paenibacillus sp. GCM10027627]|uniref:LysM peptidoglycan-binding domain-containing protein n=1 Tax=unclassified Paenibacillus TaxID=185978 RepID=UPI00362E280E